jgi:hypothetical protein
VDSFRSSRKKNKDGAFQLLRLPLKWAHNLGNRINEDHLIVLDRKSTWFIAGLIVLFSGLTIFKIHYSSIPIWDSILSERDSSAHASRLIWGTPKFIRIDEWRGVTPFILSQAAQHFPTANYALGPGKIPVLMGLPSLHFSALFQPQNWGFFVFGLERGFSFFWNYGVASILLSSFLLCMLISRNKFWPSIFGMLFLFFSSFVQWWFFASMGAMYSAFFFMIISFIYLVSSRKRLTIILSSASLVLFAIDFALWLYPPYMVPLGLLSITCCVGYLMQYCTWDMVKTHFRFRIVVGVCCLVCLAIFGIAFYRDLHATMAQAMNTVYPGKRFSTGGNFGVDRLFSGFYALFFTETRFLWGNICETSGFVLVYPVIISVVLWRAVKGKLQPLQISLSIYLLALSAFVLFGFPAFLSRCTMLSFVPSYRAIIGLGVGNIILAVAFLSNKEERPKLSPTFSMMLFVVPLVCFLAHGLFLAAESNHFFQPWHVSAVCLYFSAATWFLLSGRKLIFCCMILAVVISSTCTVLPISRGLGFIIDKKLYRTVKEISEKDPQGKWLIFGSGVLGELVTATGAPVVNGTKYCPDSSTMNVLDPSGRGNAIYNRFAHIFVMPCKDTSTVHFRLVYEDAYEILMSPLSPKVRDLHVTYLLVPSDTACYNIEQGKRKGIVPLVDKPIDNFWILKVRDNALSKPPTS